jgi:hypothetical protein
MLYSIGRFLQMAALLILPIAVAGNVAEKIDLRDSLTLSGVGVVVFIIGWLLQQFGRPQ